MRFFLTLVAFILVAQISLAENVTLEMILPTMKPPDVIMVFPKNYSIDAPEDMPYTRSAEKIEMPYYPRPGNFKPPSLRARYEKPFVVLELCQASDILK